MLLLHPQGSTNYENKLVTAGLVIGALLAPVASYAEDTDLNRMHPLTFVKDSVITTKVKAMLADEKMKNLIHIKVDTTNKGEVVLSGFARTQAQADKAVEVTRAVEGVTSVTSKITIKADD